MVNEFLNKIKATYGTKIPAYVEVGFGQVEPNHLSAQRTSQVYAQLPAAADIEVLQQGQFVKYDYAAGVVDFAGAGEWMLVYNEIKLYREFQKDCEFAMIKDNYQARIYSPFGGPKYGEGTDVVDFYGQGTKQSRYYNGVDDKGNDGYTFEGKFVKATTYKADTTYYTADGEEATVADAEAFAAGEFYVPMTFKFDDVTAAPDMYEPFYNEDPFHIAVNYKEQRMPEGTQMVPRVFKTNVGDIFTTNTIDEETLKVGDILAPRAADGILVKDDTQAMKWQVVKVYTMPDHQKGVKLMRIA